MTGLLVPAIVCLAFSVELELKSILFFLELGELARGKHRLDELFKCLPTDLQAEISELCNSTRSNFEAALREDSMTFVTWRYSHEHGLLRVNTSLLLDLSNACASVYGKLNRPGD